MRKVNKMNANVKKKWVAALRSGQYRLTRKQLRKVGFCCLGVLCDIHDPKKWELEDVSLWSYDGQTESLPQSVREWAGLPEDGKWDGLYSMNDSGHANFYKIADWIEENL